MANVAVTNKGEGSYSKRFDGKLYAFPAGGAAVIPEEVAAFLFGYGKSDAERARILIRNGWQQNGTPGDPRGPEAAQARLAEFVFKRAADDDPAPKKPKSIAPAQMTLPAQVAARAPVPMNDSRGHQLALPQGRAPREQPAA